MIASQTPLFFLRRMTPAEELAFNTSPDAEIILINRRFLASERICLNDPETQRALQILSSKGIFTPERIAAIFA